MWLCERRPDGPESCECLAALRGSGSAGLGSEALRGCLASLPPLAAGCERAAPRCDSARADALHMRRQCLYATG